MVLSRSELAGLPFDGAVLREKFRRHLSGAEDQRWGLWRLLSLSLWEARHCRGPAVPSPIPGPVTRIHELEQRP
jgi:hypothetical protein